MLVINWRIINETFWPTVRDDVWESRELSRVIPLCVFILWPKRFKTIWFWTESDSVIYREGGAASTGEKHVNNNKLKLKAHLQSVWRKPRYDAAEDQRLM